MKHLLKQSILALVLGIIALPFFSCGGDGKSVPEPTVKNIIFVIGDGMGTAQVYSSIVARGDSSSFLKFPYSGFSRTYSLNNYTTESAAGATALMTGHKVNNHAICYSPEGECYKSLMAYAQEMGKATGFVVTSSVLDATPASTYAHVPERHMFDTISLQLSQSPLDVMIGGDRGHFRPENRHDGYAPIDTLLNKGYEVVYTIEDMRKSESGKLCALLSEDVYPDWPASRRGPMLPDGFKKALSILSKNDAGFVMLVEGSQIDWSCHNNDSAYMREEMNEFDHLLDDILEFAAADGQTLIVVTADHETGGLVLLNGDIASGISNTHYVTGNHSGVMVPVFAFGPKAERFTGVQQNVDIFNKLLDILNGK